MYRFEGFVLALKPCRLFKGVRSGLAGCVTVSLGLVRPLNHAMSFSSRLAALFGMCRNFSICPGLCGGQVGTRLVEVCSGASHLGCTSLTFSTQLVLQSTNFGTQAITVQARLFA